ncbi:MAG: SDR family NAD(P)-dependent oxidoreductase, partial [Gammaproteobacteria bacterium]
RAAVAAIHRHAARVLILVNNAGVEAGGAIGSPGFAEAWRRVMDVNLDGTMRAVEALLPDLRAGGGCIVNVASIQSLIAYQAGTSAYASSKAALAQFTRSLAIELAPDGIRVNAIAPGFFATAMTAGTRSDPARLEAFRARTPMKRMGEPAELTGPVLFLVSQLSSYVTGVVLPVDGGLLAQ